MKKYLCSDNVFIRFAALYSVGLVLFLTAWYVSYLFFPEGILRGGSAAGKLVGDTAAASLMIEFIRIALVNLVLSLLIVSGNAVLKINNYPLGYLIPLVWLLIYGVLLGTNSFTIPMEDRLGPSLVVLQRSGLYELAAFAFIAAATYPLSRYQIKKLFVTNPEEIEPGERKSMNTVEIISFIFAVILLLAANLWEASMIINV